MTHDTTPNAGPGSEAGLLAPGTQFGAYQILRLLGAGGMGQVYEAMHVALSKHVAIKVIIPEHAQSSEVVARFLREAQATARIRHPNVVDVTDVGEVNGVPFLVMEFLEGEPLSSRIRRQGLLSATEALDLVIPVLAALEAAHEQGIVHRDIKPDNIFLVKERGGTRPTLVDFGISKLLDGPGGPGAGSLTKTSLVVGTPYYMAPEQAQDSKRVDARADVYAMGVVLYEMLAGVVPFSGDSLMSILLQIAQGDYPPLLERRPDLDPALAKVVAMAMAIQTSNRYASASDYARALLPFASPALRTRYESEFRTPTAFEAGKTGISDRPGAFPNQALATPLDKTARWGDQDKQPTTRERAPIQSSTKTGIFVVVGLGAVLIVGGVLAKVFLGTQAPMQVVAVDPDVAPSPPTTQLEAPVSNELAPVPADVPPGKPPLPGNVPPPENEAPTNDARPPTLPPTHSPTHSPTPTVPPVHAVAPVPEPTPAAVEPVEATSHANVHLRFSGDCSPSFGGQLTVGGNESAVMVNSIQGTRMTGNVTVAACRGTGRFELGAMETAQRGVMVSVVQGMRMWTVMPNMAAEPGQALNSGHIQVTRSNCDQGIIDVRFENAVLVSPNRSTTCTVNGTLQTTGSDL